MQVIINSQNDRLITITKPFTFLYFVIERKACLGEFKLHNIMSDDKSLFFLPGVASIDSSGMQTRKCYSESLHLTGELPQCQAVCEICDVVVTLSVIDSCRPNLRYPIYQVSSDLSKCCNCLKSNTAVYHSSM